MSAHEGKRTAAEEAVAAHYGLLLGIQSPWRVLSADLELAGQRVEIAVEHDPKKPVSCPECGKACARYDHAAERRWRHLDVMQFTTIIRARVPRCQCPEHGVGTVRAPWAEPGSRFTLMFEAFAVKVIEASRSLTQAADLLRLDSHTVQDIVARAVERGLLCRSTEALRQLGFDEKSFRHGQDYIALMTDLKQRRVLEVVEGASAPSVAQLWLSLSARQRKRIEAVAIDMSGAFMGEAQIHAPQAAIVHDRFHVARYLNDAVDRVRKDEHRKLLAAGDKSLIGTKYLWLQGAMPTGDRALSFEQLCARNLKTARAWVYKETFNEFWTHDSVPAGREFLRKWLAGACRSSLVPVKKVAATLKAHTTGLLNYFLFPITNAITEGFNSKIQAIKADARGFRRFAHYRARILFHCGKLNLLPKIPGILTH